MSAPTERNFPFPRPQVQRPYQVKDTTGKVYRVVAAHGLDACQIIANRRNVAVIAWRESKAAEDSIRIGNGWPS